MEEKKPIQTQFKGKEEEITEPSNRVPKMQQEGPKCQTRKVTKRPHATLTLCHSHGIVANKKIRFPSHAILPCDIDIVIVAWHSHDPSLNT